MPDIHPKNNTIRILTIALLAQIAAEIVKMLQKIINDKIRRQLMLHNPN